PCRLQLFQLFVFILQICLYLIILSFQINCLYSLGSHYGTFGGPIQAMSALQNPRKPNKSPGKNFYTNPPKKGSGYSFPDVTLSKMVSHSSDPYDRAKEMLKREVMAHKSMLKGGAFRLNLHPVECFNSNPYKFDKPLQPPKKTEEKKHIALPFKPSSPSKKTGGMKAGTFDSYPTYSAEPYGTKKTKSAMTNKEVKIFHPSPGPKSTPVKSIIMLNALHNNQSYQLLNKFHRERHYRLKVM
uniref:Cilia-and flagella-associated protein 96 n=1 Tax=Sinocyclocheilus grahami TaxID=75366 RepID=A0A672KB28_SINGR